ncbi:hypothetical protein M514_07474 [Trichuris suis]|uniref:Uncharacterized protein n=1 Tax=Trichuris suis TaxID=68888 RepID=A0A085NE37_9BILA|nr:hypothetical protein M513_07474 [Trichuris suis]KFD67733.1 hypothetical protein M514_07474 [Trichuris suis]
MRSVGLWRRHCTSDLNNYPAERSLYMRHNGNDDQIWVFPTAGGPLGLCNQVPRTRLAIGAHVESARNGGGQTGRSGQGDYSLKNDLCARTLSRLDLIQPTGRNGHARGAGAIAMLFSFCSNRNHGFPARAAENCQSKVSSSFANAHQLSVYIKPALTPPHQFCQTTIRQMGHRHRRHTGAPKWQLKNAQDKF